MLTARPAPPLAQESAACYGPGTQVHPINNLTGTVTYSVRRASGWSCVAFFNFHPPNNHNFTGDIARTINAAWRTVTPPATGDLCSSQSQ